MVQTIWKSNAGAAMNGSPAFRLYCTEALGAGRYSLQSGLGTKGLCVYGTGGTRAPNVIKLREI
jgi:hypothetical protein